MARGKNRRYSFQQYMTEARIRPFELEAPPAEGEAEPRVISIDPPTGDDLLAVTENSDRPRKVLQILCGDKFDDVIELVGPAPAQVLTALIGDMTEHFGMTAAPGDSGASSS